MHYKPKYVPRAGYVGDADALMREFNRAERAAGEIDQNNLKDLGVLYTHAALPSTSANAATFTHDAGSTLLLVNPNDGTLETMTNIAFGTAVSTREEWVPIYDGFITQTPVALTFTLTSAQSMIIIGQVEWAVGLGASNAYHGIRLRVLVDGNPLDTTSTCHAEQRAGASVRMGGYVQEIVTLSAGAHRVEMQGADMRQGDPNLLQVSRRTILAMGFPR